MHLDVLDLRAFYYRTRLGRAAQRALQEALRALWPDTRGSAVVGFGFAAPMLRPFLADAARVLALMPNQQGVMPWPAGGAERLRAGRGDPLADRRGLRRPADRRARARDLRKPRRADARDLAGAGARRPRGLHRAEPLRPLGAARRHAVRLRPALQPRPARGAGCASIASSPNATPARSTCRRRTASSGSRRPTLWERLGRRFDPRLRRRRAAGRGLEAGLCPPVDRRQGVGPAARSRCSKASPDRRPSRSAAAAAAPSAARAR